MRCGRQEYASKKTWLSAHTCSMCCDKIPPIFLTAPPSYEPMACHIRRCEKRLRDGKLATSSQISTRVVIRSRSLRSSRRVPPTVGVWKTVRERAKAVYTCSSEGSRGPQVCSSDSATSQFAWRRAESVLPTPAGPKHKPIVRWVRIVCANSVKRRCSLVAMKGPVRRPLEPAVMACPQDRYTILTQYAVASPPLASVAGCFGPDPEESRQRWQAAH